MAQGTGNMSEIVKKVEELFKLPQNLCKTCGKCCRIATYKGALHYEDVKKIAEGQHEEPTQIDGARDFLTIFTPYDTTADARAVAPEFVDSTLKKLNKKDDEMSFFYCKYVGDNGMCMIHEDRPLLCRMYPIPHERTLYFPGCGFEEQGKKNWEEIVQILKDLEAKKS